MNLVRLERNYSSWSLRAWLMLKQCGRPFTETTVPILDGDHNVHLRALSPSGKVPVLHAEGMILWESMAIGEYLYERYPRCGLYPEDARQRAQARCLANEMHAGFASLREHCPMDIRSRHQIPELPPRVQKDVERIQALWRERLEQGGPYLFGEWSLADAMYAPVVTRFRTYGVEMDAACGAYCERVLGNPWMAEWCRLSEEEQSEVVPGLDGPTHIRRRP